MAVVKIKAKRAVSLREKTIGLIGSTVNQPLLIMTRFGIHTFGLKYHIDVLILDKKKRVVAIKKNLAPNRIFIWNIKHDTILEIPKLNNSNYNVKLNDYIMLT